MVSSKPSKAGAHLENAELNISVLLSVVTWQLLEANSSERNAYYQHVCPP